MSTSTVTTTNSKKPRHFLTLLDCTPEELNQIIQRAIELKAQLKSGAVNNSLENRVMTMIFEKSSTRTRVSFEAGMAQMGGHAIFLSSGDSQMGRGEPIKDSARVISSMTDIVMIRTFDHETVENFAEFSSVPVINALTDGYHPCQLLADMQTYVEHRGSIAGKTVAWVGDGNNMCNSYINAARQWGFKLRMACPDGYDPLPELVELNAERVTLTRSPSEAVTGADLVVTDTWASMGQEDEKQARMEAFDGYEVNLELMSKAAPDALFMHCLPAYRGMEVSDEVMEHPQYSVVFDEAENRLHAQKALVEFLLNH